MLAGRDPRLDPKYFYEQVAPSDWQPPEGDSCFALYRRAYCGYGDLLFPPLYFSVIGETPRFAASSTSNSNMAHGNLDRFDREFVQLVAGCPAAVAGISMEVAYHAGSTDTCHLFCMQVSSVSGSWSRLGPS